MCGTSDVCVNTEGSFDCVCTEGFTGDGRTCTGWPPSYIIYYIISHSNIVNVNGNAFFFTDINECTENLDDCSDNANCVNLIGSFECLCLDGFRGDGRTCSGLMFA